MKSPTPASSRRFICAAGFTSTAAEFSFAKLRSCCLDGTTHRIGEPINTSPELFPAATGIKQSRIVRLFPQRDLGGFAPTETGRGPPADSVRRPSGKLPASHADVPLEECRDCGATPARAARSWPCHREDDGDEFEIEMVNVIASCEAD